MKYSSITSYNSRAADSFSKEELETHAKVAFINALPIGTKADFETLTFAHARSFTGGEWPLAIKTEAEMI